MLDAKITSIDFKTRIPDLVGGDRIFSRRMYVVAFVVFLAAVVASLYLLAGNPPGRIFERAEDMTPLLREFVLPDLAAKKAGVQRIAYVSNSHATTGGDIAEHIRKILARIDPGKYEVIDLAAPGMYGSEMLLRTASSGKYQIDTFVYAPNYMTFADRMTFQQQAVRVRHFFRDGVPFNAPPGFWLRNYDLPLFLDDAAGTVFPAFKRRAQNRQLWEPGVARWMKQFMGEHSRIRFLEVDYRQAWRFPGGFAGDLFNWRLIEGKRARQIADFADTVHLAKRDGAKVAIFDVPVDFAKYYVVPNMDDVNAFKLAIKHASAEADLFQDYQGQFPAEFTTYDALHPNLYGARLHAFDMIGRMNETGLLARKYDAGQILAAFKDLGAEALEAYGQQLARVRTDLKNTAAPSWNWASLDITAPLHSLQWLNNLATNYESNPEKVALIYHLFVQLRYLDVVPATTDVLNAAKSLGDGFFQAYSYEGNLARSMNDVFLKNAREVVRERHNLKEIPPIIAASQSSSVKSYQVLRKCGPIRLTAANGTTSASEQDYFIGEERVAVESPDPEGRMLRRTDVFSDGSFVLLEANAATNRWFLPYQFICPSNGYGVESLPGKPENGLTN